MLAPTPRSGEDTSVIGFPRSGLVCLGPRRLGFAFHALRLFHSCQSKAWGCAHAQSIQFRASLKLDTEAKALLVHVWLLDSF